MPERVCNNCRWFVEETDTIGDYQHEEAVRLGKGFCLIQDLFTQVSPEYPACEEYLEEKYKKGSKNDIIGINNKNADALP